MLITIHFSDKVNGGSSRIVAMASGDTSDPSETVQELLKPIQETVSIFYIAYKSNLILLMTWSMSATYRDYLSVFFIIASFLSLLFFFSGIRQMINLQLEPLVLQH